MAAKKRSRNTETAVGGASYAKAKGMKNLGLLLTEEDRETLRVAAAHCGESSAAFARRVVLEAARKVRESKKE